MKTLRPYQEEAVEILAEGGLNASGLGAGKTLISVETCRSVQPLHGGAPRILVVAPITTLRQWEMSFAEQYPSLRAKSLVHVVGTPHKDPEAWSLMTKKRPGVYIIGWEAMHGAVPDEIRRGGSRGRNANRRKPKVTMAAVRSAIAKGFVPPWTRTGVWDVVILDEVHRACNHQGVPFHVLKLIKAVRRLGLSATPGGNSPEGLWAVLNLLWPEKYANRWDWLYEHFKVTPKVVRGAPAPVLEIGRELRPGSVWNDIPAVVRFRTEEVYSQLPPVIERVVTVPMAPEQQEQYLDFEEQCLAWLSDQPVATPLPVEQRIRLRQVALGTLKAEEAVKRRTYRLSRKEQEILKEWADYQSSRPREASAWGDFVRHHNRGLTQGERHLLESHFQRMLYKQRKLEAGIEAETITLEDPDISFEEQAEQPKLDAIKDILADLPEDEPLLVWTHSAKWARMAEKKLGSKAVSWTSSTTETKRRKIEDGFGTQWRVLIAQLQSLSTGVDWLKDACRCEVIASHTEDEVINQQAEGRLRRPGQKSPVQRWRLVSERTIDDKVYQANMLKRARMGLIYQDNVNDREGEAA
ncbi:SNF2-related protein [Streptomyces sp. NPDC058947]|uniref:SNF2-related protein n=1 Tax=Streptomyces sp. NPDC058947 TaxID=3346675 RepID=UPI0036C9350F